MRSKRFARGRLAELALILAIFVVQVVLITPLFDGEFTKFRGSIEAAFITDARFIADHFPDLSWSPLWYLGFPFEWFYTPLLPALVAVVGKLSGDVPHAYRVVSALGFALGPVALYLAARELTRSRWVATTAAAAFMFFPSLSYLLAPLRGDAAAIAGAIVPPPWRLIVLVEYGEGPHVLSVTLALFAVAAAIRYLRDPRPIRLAIAVGLVVAVGLTNLIGLLGVALLLFGLGASRLTGIAATVRWGRLTRVGIYAGLFSLGWYSLGFIRAVFGFSAPGGDGGSSFYVALPGILFVVFVFGDLIAKRGWPAGSDTVLLWVVTFATIVVPQQLFHIALAPQPIRYLLELDAAFAIGLGIVVVAAGDQVLRRLRPAANRRFAVTLGAALLFLAIGLPGWRAVRPALEPDATWTSWSERSVSLWLHDHLGPNERAYLSGDHAFWVDAFADVPQVRGGVDFAFTNPWWAQVTYQVNTGADRDISLLWFEALPVRYVVVTDATSTDVYRDFVDPHKFDGLLPVVFDERGVRIYEVPRVGDPAVSLVSFGAGTKAPVNAIDRAALEAYVADIKAATLAPRRVTQSGLGSWSMAVDAPSDTTLVLRQAYDSGWRATVDGLPAVVRADPIGQIAVPVPEGRHDVHLDHHLHRDLLIGLLAASGTALYLVLRRLRRTSDASASLRNVVAGGNADVLAITSIVGVVSVVGMELSAWSGFPKGTDAYSHLTRLRFVADHFPAHHWLYAWSAGMPTFETYPGLPYLIALPVTWLAGADMSLRLIAFVGLTLTGVGYYGAIRGITGSRAGGLIGALAAITSMATWSWVVEGGVYARVFAFGVGACALWAATRWGQSGGLRSFVATAALIAAAIASHQFIGAVFALGIGTTILISRARPVRGVAALAGLSALLAAPAIVPAVFRYGGFTERFVGLERSLGGSAPDVLVRPDHVGIAVLPILVLGLVLAGRPRRSAIALAVVPAFWTLYLFAPGLGIPSRLYYVNGIDPFSVTFLIATSGALAAGVAIGQAVVRRGDRTRLIRVALIVAMCLLAANGAVGSNAFATSHRGPGVRDTSSSASLEGQSQATLRIDGNDLDHRFAPATALESVWFSYRYAKPELRDYYGTGVIHPDWLAWAYAGLYSAPYRRARFDAVTSWFALDGFSVDLADPNFNANLDDFARDRRLQVVAEGGDPPRFRQYAIAQTSEIVRPTDAKLVVIVGDRIQYDLVARAFLDQGVDPGSLVPVAFPGLLSELPRELLDRALAVVVRAGGLADAPRAESMLETYVRGGGRVIFDAGSTQAGQLSPFWPVTRYERSSMSDWRLTGDVDAPIAEFSPAEFEGGPWNAPLAQALSPDARVVLAQDGQAVIAERHLGDGVVLWLGGNLLFHARSNANDAETAYLLALFGPVPAATHLATEPRFVDPEHIEARVERARGLLLSESYHPNWHANWAGGGGLHVYEAGPGVVYVPLLGPPGVVQLSMGFGWPEYAAWVLFAFGFGLSLICLRRTLLARTRSSPPLGGGRPGRRSLALPGGEEQAQARGRAD